MMVFLLINVSSHFTQVLGTDRVGSIPLLPLKVLFLCVQLIERMGTTSFELFYNICQRVIWIHPNQDMDVINYSIYSIYYTIDLIRFSLQEVKQGFFYFWRNERLFVFGCEYEMYPVLGIGVCHIYLACL